MPIDRSRRLKGASKNASKSIANLIVESDSYVIRHPMRLHTEEILGRHRPLMQAVYPFNLRRQKESCNKSQMMPRSCTTDVAHGVS